jgi:hypothetical protein
MWCKPIFLLFIATSFHANPLAIQQISEPDRRDLERFFQLLITRETFGYTLFGEKPISCATYLSLENSNELNTTKYLILEKGWQAWLRNKHLFSEKHFFLQRKLNHKIFSIHLINKKKTLRLIHENLDAFRFLGLTDPKAILDKICSDEPKDNPLRSISLLGIFYGYGKKNSQNFECEANLMKSLSSKMAPPFSAKKMDSKLLPEASALIKPLVKRCKFGTPRSDPEQNHIETFNQLASSRKTFDLQEEFSFFTQFASPIFVFWDEKEAAQLRASYHKTREYMKEIYQTGSFLEITLQQWDSPQ